MKKIFTSLALLAVTTIGAFAQKVVDLGITVTSPTELSVRPNLAVGDSLQFVVSIKNNGTAAVVAGDSLAVYAAGYRVNINTNQLVWGGRLITGVSIPSGSSYTYSYWVKKGSYSVAQNGDTLVNWFWDNDTNNLQTFVAGWDATGAYFTDAGFDNSTEFPVEGGNNISSVRKYILGSVTGINDRTVVKASTLNTYPNPTTGLVSFDYNFTSSTEAKVAVVDVTGKQVYTKNFGVLNGKQTLNLDLSSLANGMYTIELMTNDGIGLSKITVSK